MKYKYLRVVFGLVAILLLSLALDAKGKGDKLYKDGTAAEQRQDWDKALDLYLQALDEKPGDPAYMIAMRRARFAAGQKHVNAGQKLRQQGKVEDAMAEFQKALIADPSSSIAIQEIRHTQEILNLNQKQPPANESDRGLTLAERARQDEQRKLDSLLPPPELKPVLHSVGPLKINNQPMKVIYETIGKVAGVNVLFDSQMTSPSHNFNVDLPLSTPEQAFDYLGVETHTFWKAVSPNTIFVTEDNATKHRDFDDDVMKTVYVTNATSVQDFGEIVAAVRAVAEIRRTFQSNALKAIVMRGSADAVMMAEKIIHDLDKPKAEVVVDVIVMQANSARTRDLAASIVNSSGTPGLTIPLAFTPRNPVLINGSGSGTTTTPPSTTTGGTTTNPTPTTTPTTTPASSGTSGVSLATLSHISTNDFSTTLPGALLNMLMTDSKTKVLNHPVVRASDGMKVSLAIGQKIPYATGSFQPGVGTVGVSPLVSTQFNFIDVGVNVDITPTVHADGEVSMHIEINVSSVGSYVDLGGGLSQPVVSQNKNIADIRMKEGEVNILGGLSSSQDTQALNGIPGLTNIPVLGKFLFGSQHSDKENGQLLIALIPHIIRTPDYSAENLRPIYVGSEQVIKVLRAPQAGETPAAPAAAQPVENPAGANPAAVPAAPGAAPATPAANPAGNPGVPPGPAGALRVSFAPAAVTTTAGSPVTVNVQIEGAADVVAASPIHIKFDPAQLRLNDAVAGAIFSRDGTRATIQKDIRNDSGEATLTISRPDGAPGISGSGAMVTLNFVAVGRGTSAIRVTDAALRDSKQQATAAAPAEMNVTVQ